VRPNLNRDGGVGDLQAAACLMRKAEIAGVRIRDFAAFYIFIERVKMRNAFGGGY
jgi:hypothetical protein